jgi:hypothetical protein
MAFALLMPIGGPVHKAAVAALDQFMVTRVWKGRLSTAFFDDTQKSYTLWKDDQRHGADREVRNGFWTNVLGLVDWKQGRELAGNETSQGRTEYVRTRRPVFILKLSRAPETLPEGTRFIDGDVGAFKLRYAAGIIISEVSTLAFGIATAVTWKSPFAIWYLGPLLLKCMALLFRIRREALERVNIASTEEIVCEIDDFTKGFMLICGPRELVRQYFKHYGHPLRRGC